MINETNETVDLRMMMFNWFFEIFDFQTAFVAMDNWQKKENIQLLPVDLLSVCVWYFFCCSSLPLSEIETETEASITAVY